MHTVMSGLLPPHELMFLTSALNSLSQSHPTLSPPTSEEDRVGSNHHHHHRCAPPQGLQQNQLVFYSNPSPPSTLASSRSNSSSSASTPPLQPPFMGASLPAAPCHLPHPELGRQLSDYDFPSFLLPLTNNNKPNDLSSGPTTTNIFLGQHHHHLQQQHSTPPPTAHSSSSPAHNPISARSLLDRLGSEPHLNNNPLIATRVLRPTSPSSCRLSHHSPPHSFSPPNHHSSPSTATASSVSSPPSSRSPLARSNLMRHSRSDSTNNGQSLSISSHQQALPFLQHHFKIASKRLSCYGSCIYSQSGFDLIGALARVDRRPNPQINIGPIDTSTAIVVVDARQPDLPIVFASQSFTQLTGYDLGEILGRNCRFLQDPPQTNKDSRSASEHSHSPTPVTTTRPVANYPMLTAVHTRPQSPPITRRSSAKKIKNHITKGREIQSTILNYRKDGHAFTNLLTVIPITWDSQEIAYFVGFQVDIVQQTDAISSWNTKSKRPMISLRNPPSNKPAVPPSLEPSFVGTEESVPSISDPSPHAPPNLKLVTLPRLMSIDLDRTASEDSVINPKMVLAQCQDLILAVSLKGTIFHVTRPAEKVMGYRPSELVHENISKICHNSDLTGILRQLKEIGNVAHTAIEMNFRAVRKTGEIIWMEFQGELHVEAGKGRKYVVVTGRERRIGQMSWETIKERGGGVRKQEFWTKFSRDGLCLFSTRRVRELLGYEVREMIGRTFKEIMTPIDDGMNDVVESFDRACWFNEAGSVVHLIRHRTGHIIKVISHFYPDQPSAKKISEYQQEPALAHNTEFVYCQTQLISVNSQDQDQVEELGSARIVGLDSIKKIKSKVGTQSSVFERLETDNSNAWK